MFKRKLKVCVTSHLVGFFNSPITINKRGNFMRKSLSFLLIIALLANTGCATMFDGKTQAIAVNTTPAKADCIIKRQGTALGEIEKTPGSLVIEKSRDDLLIDCTKPGYDEGTAIDKSGVAGWTFANIIFGGLIGLAIDFGTGSINKYDTPVSVTLTPK